jgi:glycosyltransferase involved in cell wall biosynthesis
MRHGLPSVAFEVGGIPEVVVNEESGILVPFGDTESLSAAIVRLVEDRDRRKEMGASARARAEKEFSADAIVDSYLGAYRRVLARESLT